MNFNICIVQPPGYTHSLAFLELGELLLHSLKDLGHRASMQFDAIDPDAVNLLIGCHLLEPDRIATLPLSTIIVNTEPIDPASALRNEKIIECARRFETWDYSPRNIAQLAAMGMPRLKHLQLGHHPALARIAHSPAPDIDVLFYGSPNDRRMRILDGLTDRGLAVHHAFGVYGAERDALIARSRLVLNLHYYESRIFEVVRVFYLLSNAVAVVGEVNANTAVDPAWLEGFQPAAYGDLIETCCRLIADDSARQALGQRAQQTIRRWPQHELTAQLLADQPACAPGSLLAPRPRPPRPRHMPKEKHRNPQIQPPRRPDAAFHLQLGNAHHQAHRLDEALGCYDQALRLEPGHFVARYNRAVVQQALGRFEEALADYDRALRSQPDHAASLHNQGLALQALGRDEAAVQSLARAWQLTPHDDALLGVLLQARRALCDWDGLEAQGTHLLGRLQRGEQGREGEPPTQPFVLLALTDDAALQRGAAQTWLAAHHPREDVLGPVPPRARRPKIRLGYYSADFHDHATAMLMAGMFEAHDRDRFELVAFSFGPERDDAPRRRLSAAFDKFIDVNGLWDLDVALLSREIGIDIAVDLKGLTGLQRMGIFSYRAAPLQVGYIGYPGTVGGDYLDYLVADPTLIPPGSRHHYAERIAYLPDSYQVNDRQRPIAERVFSRAELGLPADAFVFCSFCNSYKIGPELFEQWMRLLGQVPGSVLWLLEHSPPATRRLREAAARQGIDPGRLVLAPRMKNPEHLARHRAADLFLDTFPCNGHTTASDALWSGLPLVTRAGEAFASRVAASLLTAVGLPELVTHTADDYEALALALAQDPVRLRDLRSRLTTNRLTQPLFDTARSTRQLEALFARMHERHHAGLPPDHLEAS